MGGALGVHSVSQSATRRRLCNRGGYVALHLNKVLWYLFVVLDGRVGGAEEIIWCGKEFSVEVLGDIGA